MIKRAKEHDMFKRYFEGDKVFVFIAIEEVPDTYRKVYFIAKQENLGIPTTIEKFWENFMEKFHCKAGSIEVYKKKFSYLCINSDKK